MKQAIVFLLSVTVLVACNNKKQDKENEVITDPPTTTVTQDPANDSAAIRAVIIDFYNWYNSNYKKLMDYKLYTSLKKKNEAPYTINWEEVKRYQAYIRDSVTQLGDEFIKNQKIMFDKADSAFKVDVDGDVPAYFDYDWYTNSQEDPSWLLNGLTKSQKWVVNVKGDEAWAEIGTPDDKNYVAGSLLLYVGLKKEGGQWTIARIGND
ncbi:MAG TPA: hypothetical protein VGO58_03460 [Chitinophagaceae bacterium]|jgi:hypothetical protein|nr:hypothetical protein [Chitinophagaceae bacterium]